MYDNDPKTQRVLSMLRFIVLIFRSRVCPRLARLRQGPDSAQDPEQHLLSPRILLLGKLKYLVCRNLRDLSLKFNLDH